MGPKRSKNQLRREKAKLRKLETHSEAQLGAISKPDSELTRYRTSKDKTLPELLSTDLPEEENEQTKQQPIADKENDVLKSEYSAVFEKFNTQSVPSTKAEPTSLVSRDYVSESLSKDEESEEDNEIHKSKQKKRSRLRVAISELKASTPKPQLVEWFDCDAPDPYLVVLLRTRLNYVDIPGHWQQKKDYLLAKRGTNKPAYKLPNFIRDTGISEMRNHDAESLKKLQRDRVQPKMNKLDIDYQRLHDAFFKFQTKPRLLTFGELYSEGREKTDYLRESIADMKPGKISKELRMAIGMPESDNVVPPWITLMHEYGKPPSYSHLIIPGLDTEYKNNGYTVSGDMDLGSFNLLGETWGHLEEGEESGAESELDDKANAEENEDEVLKESIEEAERSPGNSDSEKPQRVEISEISRSKGKSVEREKKLKADSGELYKVIKEKRVESNNGLLGSSLGYDLSSEN